MFPPDAIPGSVINGLHPRAESIFMLGKRIHPSVLVLKGVRARREGGLGLCVSLSFVRLRSPIVPGTWAALQGLKQEA